MGEKVDLSIKKATITIQVLKVDNHKMTKATFRQIPCRWFVSNEDQELEKDCVYFPKSDECILGWVNDNTTWLVFSQDNVLLKAHIKDWVRGNISLTKIFPQIYIAT